MTELDPRCGKHVAGLHWLRGCHVRRNARDWRMGLGQSCGRRRSLDRLSASSALSTNRNPTQSRVMWNYNFESWITFHLSGATSHWYTSASSVVWALFVLAIYALPPPSLPSSSDPIALANPMNLYLSYPAMIFLLLSSDIIRWTCPHDHLPQPSRPVSRHVRWS